MTLVKKAYDVKELVAKLKAQGVELGEEAAKIVVNETLDWVVESAPLSKTPLDDVLVIVVPAVKPSIMKQLEKINPAD